MSGVQIPHHPPTPRRTAHGGPAHRSRPIGRGEGSRAARWVISSAGRASRLHREGRRFEPVITHHRSPGDCMPDRSTSVRRAAASRPGRLDGPDAPGAPRSGERSRAPGPLAAAPSRPGRRLGLRPPVVRQRDPEPHGLPALTMATDGSTVDGVAEHPEETRPRTRSRTGGRKAYFPARGDGGIDPSAHGPCPAATMSGTASPEVRRPRAPRPPASSQPPLRR